jgi:hypothetical protein
MFQNCNTLLTSLNVRISRGLEQFHRVDLAESAQVTRIRKDDWSRADQPLPQLFWRETVVAHAHRDANLVHPLRGDAAMDGSIGNQYMQRKVLAQQQHAHIPMMQDLGATILRRTSRCEDPTGTAGSAITSRAQTACTITNPAHRTLGACACLLWSAYDPC